MGSFLFDTLKELVSVKSEDISAMLTDLQQQFPFFITSAMSDHVENFVKYAKHCYISSPDDAVNEAIRLGVGRVLSRTNSLPYHHGLVPLLGTYEDCLNTLAI
jgi:hypothetical protein